MLLALKNYISFFTWCKEVVWWSTFFVHKEIAHHQCCLIPMAYFGIWCSLLLFPLCYSNVGEALVGKGLATVVRYRMEDDQRSEHYDELLAAEARAQKKGVGLHSKKEAPIHRVADVSGVSGFCFFFKVWEETARYFRNKSESCNKKLNFDFKWKLADNYFRVRYGRIFWGMVRDNN